MGVGQAGDRLPKDVHTVRNAGAVAPGTNCSGVRPVQPDSEMSPDYALACAAAAQAVPDSSAYPRRAAVSATGPNGAFAAIASGRAPSA